MKLWLAALLLPVSHTCMLTHSVQGCWMVTGIFSEHDLLNTDWQQQQHI